MKMRLHLESYLGRSIAEIRYSPGTWQENKISSDFSNLNPNNFALNVKYLQLEFECGELLTLTNKQNKLLRTATIVRSQDLQDNLLTVPHRDNWNKILNLPITKIDCYRHVGSIISIPNELTLLAIYFTRKNVLLISSRIFELHYNNLTPTGQLNDNLQICINRSVDINRFNEDVRTNYKMLKKTSRIKNAPQQ